jgi:hypothetical protein
MTRICRLGAPEAAFADVRAHDSAGAAYNTNIVFKH